MKFLRKQLDKIEIKLHKPGWQSRLYPLYEMVDTFLYTPATVTRTASHIRDAIDFKRAMIVVGVALLPSLIMGVSNLGWQINTALAQSGNIPDSLSWRMQIIRSMGFGFNAQSWGDNLVHGLVYFLPLYLVVNLVGGFWEAMFAIVRKHEINEGFLVTGILFPMILPPSIPLWQAALGISFAVVFGKEVFGGTGMNVFNPALVGRAFLFFSFPVQMSGNEVWVPVDGYSGATSLAVASEAGNAFGPNPSVLFNDAWMNSFLGNNAGTLGETSTLGILIGAAFLIFTGIGSWRIMLSVVSGMFVMSTILCLSLDNPSNSLAALDPMPAFLWHFVLGGFAFGTVFMATDPVSAAVTNSGQWIYGLLIGVLVVLIRVVNPAFPEGMMLAILFGNAFAPLIDNYVIKNNIKRRAVHYGR
jgi:Na+-transporting NADH:ubiquinone oxidoreductase subunit B